MTKKHLKQKFLFWNIQLTHYETVVRPETLYATEPLKLTEILKSLTKLKERNRGKSWEYKNSEYKLRFNKYLY